MLIQSYTYRYFIQFLTLNQEQYFSATYAHCDVMIDTDKQSES